MAQHNWGKNDTANNAPNWPVVLHTGSVAGATPVTGNVAFANTTVGAFRTNQAVGIFGTSVAEAQAIGKGVTPGWNVQRRGTGPVVSLNIIAPGRGYNNTDVGKVYGGTSNAAFTIVTDANGSITSVTLTSGGAGFINVANSTIGLTNSTGGATSSNANIGFTLGGRAGRVTYETLVAFGGDMTGNSSILT